MSEIDNVNDPIPRGGHTWKYLEARVIDVFSSIEVIDEAAARDLVCGESQFFPLKSVVDLIDGMVERGDLIRFGSKPSLRLRSDLVSPARIPAVGTRTGTQIRAVARAMVRVGPMTREEVQQIARISCCLGGGKGNLSWLTTFSGGLTAETRLWFPVDVTRDVRGADGSVRVKQGKQVLVPGRLLLSVVRRLEDVSREVPDRERDSLLQRIAVDNDFDLCGRIDVRPEDGWVLGSFLPRERYRF